MPQTNDVEAVEIRELGIRVTPTRKIDVMSQISRRVNSETVTIAAHNLHSVYLMHTDAGFRSFYEKADLTVIDGWPILAALNRHRRRSGRRALSSQFRMGSTDWVLDAIALDEIKSVCILGASPSSNASLIRRIEAKMPHKLLLGIPGVPWSETGRSRALECVAAFKPDLTLIGMGMPLQEEIAGELRQRLTTGVIATVGGAIDQLSGTQNHAPRWTGPLRVEWLWRLASDPRRLAHRYLIEPFKLGFVLSRQRRKAAR